MQSLRACVLIVLCLWPAATPFARERHAVEGVPCGGYPRLAIGTLRGMCAGLVLGPTTADGSRPIRLPRSLLQLDAKTWLITDLGAWEGARGAVWRLRTGPGAAVAVERVLDGLHLPHAIARGPDGLVYVGEMSRILRFDPEADDPGAGVETVIGGLPDNRLHAHRHPLSKFVFLPNGDLLVNVGAPSDQCADAAARTASGLCAESEGEVDAASLRVYRYRGEGRWSPDHEVLARGLRNSLALAVHPSGTVLQAENSYDFDSRWSPFEELNVIEPGRHYGWPYCYDADAAAPVWPERTEWCRSAAHTAPAVLLPPHAAPLDMLWYEGAMFPALKGRLLMSWHGHRSVGGRIASFAVDARGVPVPDANPRFPAYGLGFRSYGVAPAATPVVLTPGWGLAPGLRPQGSPVGLAVAGDGAIWATDDRAGLVIRFAKDD
ncbi:PQQ-dependent sugar dehydrogenase [Coralloluteibacterium stylophorae]|uniref:PQQ-dependent sugar dehydrogenase n=1 Tax=Coralloluteibacterium stylophorae TaxID=1776034 RepID=A0AAP2C7V9_9GAMM|nr:PQQ-dependent sugar dehydrogenase [Coralloluteibacterium stylophorae]MBS7456023.1 PQQ-dependent sugar dehydrogenase [Coralloluteibacterium stylophorae]